MKTAMIVAHVGTLTTLFLAGYMPSNFSEDQWETAFAEFMTTHSKSYPDHTEYRYRMEIFKANFLKIDQHQRSNDASYQVEVNHFADMSEEERSEMLGFVVPSVRSMNIAPVAYAEVAPINWFK